MEATLKDACKHHGLTGIGANIFDAATGNITVYIHWDNSGGCSSGTASNFADALQIALNEMCARRHGPVMRETAI